ncbi:acetolactate decarboxylase [Nostoc sp. JL33]|uniref:acetolactate decarboxylase n=1 Tax=Nostoc sp. JL33 TaxID=2815396 RepID=UPI00260006CF|nr:acetolactate decarboxylase [Nostoc sp. JL33]MBN3871528.1 acetolactate decarboxylase [Nostoc sp. JL33]
MKLKRYLWITVLSITVLFGIILPGRTQQHSSSNTLFQTSTFNALSIGVYQGNTNFKELKKSGNFGLGTVNYLDGEMIGLDGKFYQVKADGVASVIPDSMTSPFATVTFFKPQRLINLEGQINYQQLQQSLDQRLPTKNYPYAIRIQGNFPYLKLRSVPKQTLPYRPLADALKEQSIFELRNVNGTLVGFRIPKYMQGVNVNGYHFHFITANRQTGGHIVDGQFQNAKVELDSLANVEINLPKTAEFDQADLENSKPTKVNRVKR